MDPCPVLVGRQPELAALRQLLQAGGGVAVISGEAGIGKSRLIREFAAEAEQIGRVVLWGRPEEVAQPGPYALIADLLESIVEHGGKDVKRDARALESQLLETGDRNGQISSPSARSIAAEIRGLVAQIGTPPVLVLEDLHWADEASHSVLQHLARAARDDDHLIAFSYRGEVLASSPSLGRLLEMLERDRVSTAIDLRPLSDEEVAAMLEAMLQRPLDEATRQRIARLGEGVPFFIEELADGSTATGVPRSIELTVNARLDSLSPEASEVIRLGSLLVGAIDAQVLARVLERDVEGIARDLGRGTRSGLLIDREGRVLFRHSLVRNAIANGIISVERAALHRRLAESIESMHADKLEFHCEALARHYQEAGDAESAARYLVMAGDRSLAFAATEDARSLFSRALELSSAAEVPAKRGLAEVELREGNVDQAAKLFRSVADDLAETGDSSGAARSLSRLAWALLNQAESESVLAVLDEALSLLASQEGSHEFAELLVQKGQMLSYQFARFTEAKPILEQALSVARDYGDSALVAHALDGLAHLADWEGDAEAAVRAGTEAVSASLSSGVAEIVGRSHNNQAVRLASSGRPVEALALLAEGRAHLQRAYGPAGVSALDVSHAWIAWLMGSPRLVSEQTARGQAAWQRWRGYLRMMEVWAALEQRNTSWAEKRVLSSWDELGGLQVRAESLAGKANEEGRHVLYAETLLLVHEKRWDEAISTGSALVELDRASSPEAFDRGQALILTTQVLIAARDVEAARFNLGLLNDLLAHSCPYPYLAAHATELEGSIHMIGGEFAEAKAMFIEAARMLQECSNLSDRARCTREAAEALAVGGSARDEIVSMLRSARTLAEESGATAEQDRIDALLRSFGVRPRSGRPRRKESGQVLSAREAEVAVLVAAGETNAGIARELFLSDRTVQDHITNALKKLGLSGRAGLAAWAAREGLV